MLVNGEIVYRDGRFSRLSDPAQVVAEAQRIAWPILDQAGLSHRLSPAWRM